MRAIGSSLRLKQRFGAGYQLSVSVLPARAGAASTEALAAAAAGVKALFLADLGVAPSDESKAYLTFMVPKQCEAVLPAFLQKLDAERQQVRACFCSGGLAALNLLMTGAQAEFG